MAYGLRIRSPETRLPWPEFLNLLNGLPTTTPLVQLAGIRTMSDKDAEHLPDSAQQARTEWQLWLSGRESTGAHDATGLEQFFRDFCA